MDIGSPHDQAAAYALDALDPHESASFEVHLRECALCRVDVCELQEAAAALAVAVATGKAPARVRARVLDAARRSRSNVVPLRGWRRHLVPAAAAAAVAAIAAGAWATDLTRELERERAARSDRERAVLVLVERDVDRLAVRGADGHVVRGTAGDAVLVVRGLADPPSGSTYQAWVVEGGRPVPAGTFEPGAAATVHALTRTMPEGAIVTVTLERDGGADVPTSGPILRSAPA